MSLIEIGLMRSDVGRLPPPAEFETVEAWLAALPPGTLLQVTAGVEPFRISQPVPVEAVIDGIALAPILRAHLDEAGGE